MAGYCILFLLALIYSLCYHVCCLNLKRIDSDNRETQTDYLRRYGYLNTPKVTKGKFKKAVEKFQRLWDINVTGRVDDETEMMMKLPRCGNKDIPMYAAHVQHNHKRRKKRFAILPFGGWNKVNFTYRVLNRPNTLNSIQVLTAISKAFKMWASVSPLTFTRILTVPDIDILFAAYKHGDSHFDGLGGTVAHTYFPVLGGDIHFDSSEYWTIGTGRGTDFFQTALHEIGHALGLSHTSDKAAIMYPYYKFHHHIRLGNDDINGIQYLYRRHELKANSVSSQSLCRDVRIDAALSTGAGHMYLFVGKQLIKVIDNGMATGYPRLIRHVFSNIPDNIDAAVHLPRLVTCTRYTRNRKCSRKVEEAARSYIFKHNIYYLFNNYGALVESRQISSRFPGLPSPIDAAFTIGARYLYIVKGTKYWKLKRTPTLVFERGYPRILSRDFKGLPSTIDAALTVAKYNGNKKMMNTFFFQGSKYYRITNSHFQVDRSRIPFPRKIGPDWLDCQQNGRTDKLN